MAGVTNTVAGVTDAAVGVTDTVVGVLVIFTVGPLHLKHPECHLCPGARDRESKV